MGRTGIIQFCQLNWTCPDYLGMRSCYSSQKQTFLWNRNFQCFFISKLLSGYNTLPKVVCNIFIKKELPIIIAKIHSSNFTQHTWLYVLHLQLNPENCRWRTDKLCMLGFNYFIFTIITSENWTKQPVCWPVYPFWFRPKI